MEPPRVDWECFAWNLKDHMQEVSMSTRDVEAATGVDHATLSRASNGKPCRVEVYLALCAWMKAKPMYFLCEQENV